MRNLRLVAVTAAAVTIYAMSAATVRASEGPWCAILNFGSDVTEDCQYHSLQECVQAVTAGFRGFCNHNPRWQVAEPQQLRRKHAAPQ